MTPGDLPGPVSPIWFSQRLQLHSVDWSNIDRFREQSVAAVQKEIDRNTKPAVAE